MGQILDIGEDLTGINMSGNSSSDRAVNAQQGAARDSNAMQERMYNQTREDLGGYRDAGSRAVAGMENQDFQRDFTMGDFQKDPGYDFRMKEGMKALENSAAARGGLGSGATMKALQGFGQEQASAEYGNAYNRFNQDRDRRFQRLGTMAHLGQNSAAQTGAAAQEYATQYSNNIQGSANAQAARAVGQANQFSGLMGQGAEAAAVAFCDERLKENITPVSREDLDEMKRNLKAYAFNYKSVVHGEGDFIGVMAQDLEKSKLGRTLVREDASGFKTIDVSRVMMMFLATMAEG